MINLSNVHHVVYGANSSDNIPIRLNATTLVLICQDSCNASNEYVLQDFQSRKFYPSMPALLSIDSDNLSACNKCPAGIIRDVSTSIINLSDINTTKADSKLTKIVTMVSQPNNNVTASKSHSASKELAASILSLDQSSNKDKSLKFAMSPTLSSEFDHRLYWNRNYASIKSTLIWHPKSIDGELNLICNNNLVLIAYVNRVLSFDKHSVIFFMPVLHLASRPLKTMVTLWNIKLLFHRTSLLEACVVANLDLAPIYSQYNHAMVKLSLASMLAKPMCSILVATRNDMLSFGNRRISGLVKLPANSIHNYLSTTCNVFIDVLDAILSSFFPIHIYGRRSLLVSDKDVKPIEDLRKCISDFIELIGRLIKVDSQQDQKLKSNDKESESIVGFSDYIKSIYLSWADYVIQTYCLKNAAGKPVKLCGVPLAYEHRNLNISGYPKMIIISPVSSNIDCAGAQASVKLVHWSSQSIPCIVYSNLYNTNIYIFANIIGAVYIIVRGTNDSDIDILMNPRKTNDRPVKHLYFSCMSDMMVNIGYNVGSNLPEIEVFSRYVHRDTNSITTSRGAVSNEVCNVSSYPLEFTDRCEHAPVILSNDARAGFYL